MIKVRVKIVFRCVCPPAESVSLRKKTQGFHLAMILRRSDDSGRDWFPVEVLGDGIGCSMTVFSPTGHFIRHSVLATCT